MKKIKAAGALILGLWALVSTGGAHAQSPVVIDNGAAQFATVGTWPASTTVPGFEGANYQTHEAQGSPPGAIVVDNTDAGFSVTGTWPTSTAVSGFLGANYQVHAANGEEPTSIVVDNTAGTAVGSWPTSTSVSGFFGTNYQVHAAGTGGDTFTWTPTIPTTGSYQVYARWTIHPNRSTHAVYTVNHAGGATPVTVNQEVGGGQWNLLGTFTLNAGSSHSVVLSIQDDGYVIADAIKVVPQGAAPNTASWTPTVPTAKAYHVYARWTAHPNRATDAKYTVTHAGGETTVTINQELNNGAWVLLGTFNLAPGAGHKVSLTDQANGYVIADAVRLIGTDEPQVNSATWSPNLTGEHQVYAKWTANPNRATNATYTITHAGGATPVTVNQQANGGQFNLLGSFTLTPASTITLTDNANGFVIADAIQLVSAAPVALQLYFVHTDHLNTPRLIANSTGQAVWSWNNDDPFGANAPNENPSGLGLFTCNLRFPGQYFDKETNTHYNYFRDYDSGIGRYIQSDPIGLQGGINTYAYVLSNPLSFVDPTGLQIIVPGAGGAIGGSLPGAGGPLAPGGGSRPSRPGDDPLGEIPAPGKPTWPFPSSGAEAEGGTGQSAGRLAPPGKCTQTQHRVLQDEVNAACKIQRACDPSQDCPQLLDNYYRNIRCAQARDEINNTCFAGGDAGHRQAANDARRAANRCIAVMQQKGCANCPVPPNK